MFVLRWKTLRFEGNNRLHDRTTTIRAGRLWVVWIFFAVYLTPNGGYHVVAGLVAVVDEAV